MVDFGVPLSHPAGPHFLYLLGNHPACHFDAGGDEAGVMRLTFDLSHEPHPDWKRDDDGYILCDRTVISPYPQRTRREEITLPPFERLQRWREVAWTAETFGQEVILIEIIIRGKCDKGHVTEDCMFFEPGTTLRHTIEWMFYLTQRWPARMCPGGEPRFCHRRKFHIEGDTLRARTPAALRERKSSTGRSSEEIQ